MRGTPTPAAPYSYTGLCALKAHGNVQGLPPLTGGPAPLGLITRLMLITYFDAWHVRRQRGRASRPKPHRHASDADEWLGVRGRELPGSLGWARLGAGRRACRWRGGFTRRISGGGESQTQVQANTVAGTARNFLSGIAAVRCKLM